MYFSADTYIIPARWLPPDLRGQVASYRYKLTRGEKKRLKKRKPIPPSVWAERHRVLTKSAIPGRWKNRTVPYLAGIMDASYHRSVAEITVVAVPQSGKSETVNNCVAYAVDRDPADVLYVYPDELTTKENFKDRIAPTINSSKRLSEYLTGYADDIAATRINLQHMTIYGAWANSAARLSNKPIGKAVADEVDKFPKTTGRKETGPIELLRHRLRWYRGRSKLWKISSPTIEEGPIWVEYKAAHVRFVYWVRCPDCGGWQVMAFSEKGTAGKTVYRLRVPEGCRDPQRIEAENLAWYQCRHCDIKWDDARRDAAVRRGEWREETKGIEIMAYLKAFNPKTIAFQIPAWLSPLVPLSEIMAAWFKAQKDKTKLKDFMNGYAARPWLTYDVLRQETAIMALCEDRPMGRVPGGGVVACLTFGADTQDDGFWFWIDAWGWGLTQDRWLVRAGFVTSFEALVQVLWQDEYADAEGRKYVVRFGLQDSLGHRTGEVYDFTRQYPGRILPTKGETTMNQAFTYSPVEYYPGTKRPVPGNLRRVRVNTKYFKDRLASALAVAPEDPGSIRLPADFNLDYAAHFTSEFVNEKGVWDCPDHKPNHLWDCACLSSCAAEIMGVRFSPKPDAAEAQAPAGGRRVLSQGVQA